MSRRVSYLKASALRTEVAVLRAAVAERLRRLGRVGAEGRCGEGGVRVWSRLSNCGSCCRPARLERSLPPMSNNGVAGGVPRCRGFLVWVGCLVCCQGRGGRREGLPVVGGVGGPGPSLRDVGCWCEGALVVP